MDYRDTFINVLLVILSVSVVFAGLEIGLRFTGYGGGVVDDVCYGDQRQFQFHPRYGVVGSANSQYRKRFPGDEFELYTHNEEGFRDTFDSGNKSVILLGDSFTYGRLVNDTETFAHLIDRWTPTRSIENFGIPGYSTKEEFVLYQNVSDHINHDVVVLVFYLSNDMKGNVDNNPRRPQFEITDSGVELIRKPINKTSTSSGFHINIESFLYRRSAAYAFLAPRIGAVLEQAGLKKRNTPPTGEELDRQLRITHALLAAVGRKAEHHDANLLIVTIPESGDVNPQKPKLYFPEDGRPYWNAQRRMIKRLADRHENIDTLFLKPDLKEAVSNGNRVYGRANYHFDDYGHRVAAKSIYMKLYHSGYLQNSSAPFTNDYGGNLTTCP